MNNITRTFTFTKGNIFEIVNGSVADDGMEYTACGDLTAEQLIGEFKAEHNATGNFIATDIQKVQKVLSMTLQDYLDYASVIKEIVKE